MEVHVFVFEHRHGRDVTAYGSEELAVAEGARVAREWWEEARRLEPSLPPKPPGSDAKALELYFDAQEGHEFYEIVACEVQGAEPAAGGPGRG
jgi:hypothetical protein